MKLNVKDYGAVGDGFTNDTQALQNAVDACSSCEGTLVINPGVYLTGTIILKSNIRIIIEKGAMLLGSSDFNSYKGDIRPFVDAVNQERGRCLIFGENLENVTIEGFGGVNGRGAAFDESHPEHKRRPFLFRFYGCKDINISDIQVLNSPAWCIHLQDCENVRLSGLKIFSRVNHNNDGIDIDGCSHITIENCTVDTGDDGICLKATGKRPCEHIKVESCIISSRWAAFKIGTESYGDFKDIKFMNSRIYDTQGCGIKIVPVDGANVEDVLISNISMNNCTGPIFIASGDRLRTYYRENEKKQSGKIKSITIKDIKGDIVDAEGFYWNPGEMKGFVTHNGIWGDGKGGIVVSGTTKHKIEDVILEDIDIALPGGGTKKDTEKTEIIEMEDNYPEFHVFGVLPSSAFFLRHVNNIVLKNINLKFKSPEFRQPIFAIDVDGLKIKSVESM